MCARRLYGQQSNPNGPLQGSSAPHLPVVGEAQVSCGAVAEQPRVVGKRLQRAVVQAKRVLVPPLLAACRRVSARARSVV